MNTSLSMDSWTLRSSLVFGVVAAIAMMIHIGGWSPAVLFFFVASFVLAVVFWRWVGGSADVVLVARGAAAGAAIGFFTPALAWLLYAPFLFFTAAEPREAFAWSLAYAFAYPLQFFWISMPIGILFGLTLGYWQYRELDIAEIGTVS